MDTTQSARGLDLYALLAIDNLPVEHAIGALKRAPADSPRAGANPWVRDDRAPHVRQGTFCPAEFLTRALEFECEVLDALSCSIAVLDCGRR